MSTARFLRELTALAILFASPELGFRGSSKVYFGRACCHIFMHMGVTFSGGCQFQVSYFKIYSVFHSVQSKIWAMESSFSHSLGGRFLTNSEARCLITS